MQPNMKNSKQGTCVGGACVQKGKHGAVWLEHDPCREPELDFLVFKNLNNNTFLDVLFQFLEANKCLYRGSYFFLLKGMNYQCKNTSESQMHYAE